MTTDRVFLGNIMYGSKLILENVVLIKYKDNYLDLSDLLKEDKKNVRHYTAIKNKYYYVEGLVPFYEKKKHKSLIKVKYDILSDSRVNNHLRYFY